MPNVFGIGRNFGRGFRGGMGFGFRGVSPPWPYVGIGRGGLPRCGYFFSGIGSPAAWPYGRATYHPYGFSPAAGYGTFTAPQTKEEELNILRGEAEAIKKQLEQIEARMSELATEE